MISPNVVILTKEELKEREDRAFQRGVARGRFIEVSRDRDGTEGGDANAAPVPQDCQARAEGIAKGEPQ